MALPVADEADTLPPLPPGTVVWPSTGLLLPPWAEAAGAVLVPVPVPVPTSPPLGGVSVVVGGVS